MSLDPRDHCPDCDGFVSAPAFYTGSRRCQCGVAPEDRRPSGSFAAWYLREHPDLARRLGLTVPPEPPQEEADDAAHHA